MTQPHNGSENRFRDTCLGAGAFLIASIICFLLPNCTFFGVLLVILGVAYSVCLATGMEPNANPTTTWHHLRTSLERFTPRPGGSGAGATASPPPGYGTPATFIGPQNIGQPAAFVPAPNAIPQSQQPPAPIDVPDVVDQPSPVPTPEPTVPPDVPPAGETFAAAAAIAAPVSLSKADGPTTTPPLQPPRQYFAPPPPSPTGAVYPPARNRRMLLGAVAFIAVIVVAAAVTVTAVVFTRDDDGKQNNSAYAAGMLHSAYPTVPRADFAVTPSQLETNAFTRPNYLAGGEESTGYLRSNKLIITGVAGGGLVAIDPSDGHVAWKQPSLRDIHCSDVFKHETLACRSDFGMFLLSADTGKVLKKLPDGYSAVQKLGDKYAYAAYDGATATVALGTQTNPTAYWERSAQVSDATRTFLFTSATAVAFTVSSASGGATLAFNEAGQRIGTPGGFGSLLGSDAYADQPGDSGVVTGSDGRFRYLASSAPLQPDLYAPVPDVSVAFTRTEAIDPKTGSVLWQRPAATIPDSTSYGVGDLVAVVGTVALLRSDSIGATTGVDIRTGKVLWNNDIGVSSYNVTTDGQRVIGIGSDNTLAAYDVGTGQPAWRIALPDVGEYPKVVPVGSDFAVVGSKAILGFHPTGGAATLFDGSTTATGGQSSSGGSVTACSTPATVTPENFQVSDGSLVVRLKFTAGCAGGDVLSNSQYSVTISDQASAIASSQFNLTNAPIAVPRDGAAVSRDFTFPSGTFWRLPSSLAGGSGSSTSVAGNGQSVQCTAQGTNSVSGSEAIAPSTDSGAAPLVGSVPAAGSPTAVDPAANALNALRAQADADRPLVQQSYVNRWVAQISAKQIRNPPMVATDVDDVTMVAWSPEAILRQHLTLRSRYPEVRLIYSNDWRTIDLQDWWITIAQPNVLDAPGANSWCDSKRIAPNQCFAKLISNNRGSDGTTVYRR